MLLQIILQAVENTAKVEGAEALLKIITKMGFRLLIDLVSVFILIRVVYHSVYKKRDLFFTFFIFNCIIFLICFLLNKVEMSMGAAFGLFAVFSMLRYRTEDISFKDMTYLFLVIAIGLISAVTKIKDADEYYEYIFLGLINLTLILLTYLLEGKLLFKTESVKTITYENLEMIHTNKRTELIEDLKNRTGLNVHRVSVKGIDYVKNAVSLKVFYYE